MNVISHSLICPDDPLVTLKSCDGYYECPKSTDGRRLGPLVGYAGKYKLDDGTERAYVGDVYYNFARAEQYPAVLDHFASKLSLSISEANLIMGAPMGGILLAGAIGRHLNDVRVIFGEKKITAVATATSREESSLIIDRHEIRESDRVVLVEDICNNFSTTGKVRESVGKARGTLVGIVCFLNRSPHTEFEGIPVISLLHIPTQQWKQEDPEVAGDITMGNIVWKPKNEWNRLKVAMETAAKN